MEQDPGSEYCVKSISCKEVPLNIHVDSRRHYLVTNTVFLDRAWLLGKWKLIHTLPYTSILFVSFGYLARNSPSPFAPEKLNS